MGRAMAVDIGASSYRMIEGRYFNGEFHMKEIARFKHTPVWENGHYRWNVDEMTDNLVKALKTAAEKGKPIESIAFDTFGTDFGLLDKKGQLIEHPLAYRDAVSDGIYLRFLKDDEAIYKKIGGTFKDTSSAHILKGMAEAKMDSLKRAERILFMPDLFGFLFTGKIANEYTIATTSRLLEIHTRAWERNFIEELGIPQKIFPELSEAGTVIGALKEEIAGKQFNLKNTKVVMAACHDTASAVLTIPMLKHMSFISSGTWSVKGIVTEKAYATFKACRYQMSNEGQPWGRYRLIRNITGLWLLEECVRSWEKEGKEIRLPELAQKAGKEKEFPAIIFPDAPVFAKQGNMPEKIQNYCRQTGQKAPHTPIEIMQTIIQGLACEYRRHNEQLLEVTGEKIETIYIVGGGRHNRYLNQCTANVTGCRVIAGHPEAAAAGNLLIQFWRAGEVENIEDIPGLAEQDCTPEIYEPEKQKEWEARYNFYKRLTEL